LQIHPYKVLCETHQQDSARAIQQAAHHRRQVKEEAEVNLQRIWSGFVVETEFLINIVEYRAATRIQAQWRRFYNFSNYILMLDNVIRFQTAIRRFSAFRKYEEAVGASISIQNVIRICLAQLDATNAIALKFLLSESARRSKKDTQAVCCIEKVFRAYKVRQAKLFFVSTMTHILLPGRFKRCGSAKV
jgi:hypothetical protein